MAGYYYQAINADAPHPAAARLWQEFLYSDEGQNLSPWVACGRCVPTTWSRPGTIDKAAFDELPPDRRRR